MKMMTRMRGVAVGLMMFSMAACAGGASSYNLLAACDAVVTSEVDGVAVEVAALTDQDRRVCKAYAGFQTYGEVVQPVVISAIDAGLASDDPIVQQVGITLGETEQKIRPIARTGLAAADKYIAARDLYAQNKDKSTGELVASIPLYYSEVLAAYRDFEPLYNDIKAAY